MTLGKHRLVLNTRAFELPKVCAACLPPLRTLLSVHLQVSDAANALVVDIFLSRKYDQMTGRTAVPTACATKIKLEIETLSYSEGSTIFLPHKIVEHYGDGKVI